MRAGRSVVTIVVGVTRSDLAVSVVVHSSCSLKLIYLRVIKLLDRNSIKYLGILLVDLI